MKLVKQLPEPVEDRRKDGFFRVTVHVPLEIVHEEYLVHIAVDRYMHYSKNLIWTPATWEYVWDIIGDVNNPDKFHGVVTFEIRRKTVEEMENDL